MRTGDLPLLPEIRASMSQRELNSEAVYIPELGRYMSMGVPQPQMVTHDNNRGLIGNAHNRAFMSELDPLNRQRGTVRNATGRRNLRENLWYQERDLAAEEMHRTLAAINSEPSAMRRPTIMPSRAVGSFVVHEPTETDISAAVRASMQNRINTSQQTSDHVDLSELMAGHHDPNSGLRPMGETPYTNPFRDLTHMQRSQPTTTRSGADILLPRARLVQDVGTVPTRPTNTAGRRTTSRQNHLTLAPRAINETDAYLPIATTQTIQLSQDHAPRVVRQAERDIQAHQMLTNMAPTSSMQTVTLQNDQLLPISLTSKDRLDVPDVELPVSQTYTLRSDDTQLRMNQPTAFRQDLGGMQAEPMTTTVTLRQDELLRAKNQQIDLLPLSQLNGGPAPTQSMTYHLRAEEPHMHRDLSAARAARIGTELPTVEETVRTVTLRSDKPLFRAQENRIDLTDIQQPDQGTQTTITLSDRHAPSTTERQRFDDPHKIHVNMPRERDAAEMPQRILLPPTRPASEPLTMMDQLSRRAYLEPSRRNTDRRLAQPHDMALFQPVVLNPLQKV